MFRNILVAVDGTSTAHKAVEVAGGLARLNGARLNVIHVARDAVDAWQAERDGMPDSTDEIVAREAAFLVSEGHEKPRQHVALGDPAWVIVDFARHNDVDLVIMGGNGRNGLDALLSGSVSHEVTRNAPCTCITVWNG